MGINTLSFTSALVLRTEQLCIVKKKTHKKTKNSHPGPQLHNEQINC